MATSKRRTPSKSVIFICIFVHQIKTSFTSLNCDKTMSSMSYNKSTSETQDLQGHFQNVFSRIENITASLENINTSDRVIEGITSDLHNVNESLHKMSQTILEHHVSFLGMSEEKLLQSADSRVNDSLNIAMICLWVDLKNLQRNVTFISNILSASNLANKMRFSDLSRQIDYLKGNMDVSNQNITDISERLQALQLEILSTSIRERLKTGRFDGNQKEKLSKLKSKIVKNVKYDPQSTLSNHIDPMPQDYGMQDKALKGIIDHIEDISLSIWNLTSDLKTYKSDLDQTRNDFSQRLDALEEHHEHKKDKRVPPTPFQKYNSESKAIKLTRNTCNGARRHLVGDSCYFIPLVRELDIGQTWWDARYLCKEQLGQDADLVAIESQQEKDNLTHMLQNHFGGIEEFWLGGNDLKTEGKWEWVMTSDLINEDSYTNWGHPPYDSPSQNCMSMLRGFMWEVEPCFYQRHPICELNF